LAQEHADISFVDFTTPTSRLHQLSQTWHIMGADLEEIAGRIRFLMETEIKFRALLHPVSGKEGAKIPEATSTTYESLEYVHSRCQIWSQWINNYKDRTNIRINLIFNLSSQRDNQINLQMAKDTSEIAWQTQRDSSSMITIAAVTMLFLPGAFVSAIFSMVFFSYDGSGLVVSDKWWLFPTVTIPLTAVVFGVWLFWQRLRVKRMHRQERERYSQDSPKPVVEKQRA